MSGGCFLCGLIALAILNVFFSPIAYGLLERECSKRLVLNCFLWLLGVIPGAIHGFFRIREGMENMIGSPYD